MKWIDIPPVWLLACLCATYWTGQAMGGGAHGTGLLRLGGLVLALSGVVLMGLAVLELRRWRTTVLPHQTAQTLVTSGIFARSRNPIYLGDMLVLAGYILWTGAYLALPTLGVLFWVLQRRFILPEEQRLGAAFGAAFAAYRGQTRRWL